MDTLKVNLTNCFGIEALQHEFDFTQGSVFVIYARNGLMKTSFAKTFQKFSKGNQLTLAISFLMTMESLMLKLMEIRL